MILFLNVDKQILQLYSEKGLLEIPFSQAQSLSSYIGDKTILYITDAMEVSARDVIDMLSENKVETPTNPTDTIFYLHVDSGKRVHVPEVDLRFFGKEDFKLIDNKLKKIISSSPTLSSLIKKGIIRVVGQTEKNVLLRQYQQDPKRKIEDPNERIEESLDSIILKGSVDDFVSGEKDKDAVSIDLTNDRGGKGMSDLMGEIEGKS